MEKKKEQPLSVDQLLGVEPLGMERFNHKSKNIDEALCVTDDDDKRIQAFLHTLRPPQSKAIEDIMLTKELHNLKERVYCSYHFGVMIGKMTGLRDIMGMMGGMGGMPEI